MAISRITNNVVASCDLCHGIKKSVVDLIKIVRNLAIDLFKKMYNYFTGGVYYTHTDLQELKVLDRIYHVPIPVQALAPNVVQIAIVNPVEEVRDLNPTEVAMKGLQNDLLDFTTALVRENWQSEVREILRKTLESSAYHWVKSDGASILDLISVFRPIAPSVNRKDEKVLEALFRCLWNYRGQSKDPIFSEEEFSNIVLLAYKDHFRKDPENGAELCRAISGQTNLSDLLATLEKKDYDEYLSKVAKALIQHCLHKDRFNDRIQAELRPHIEKMLDLPFHSGNIFNELATEITSIALKRVYSQVTNIFAKIPFKELIDETVAISEAHTRTALEHPVFTAPAGEERDAALQSHVQGVIKRVLDYILTDEVCIGIVKELHQKKEYLFKEAEKANEPLIVEMLKTLLDTDQKTLEKNLSPLIGKLKLFLPELLAPTLTAKVVEKVEPNYIKKKIAQKILPLVVEKLEDKSSPSVPTIPQQSDAPYGVLMTNLIINVGNFPPLLKDLLNTLASRFGYGSLESFLQNKMVEKVAPYRNKETAALEIASVISTSLSAFKGEDGSFKKEEIHDLLFGQPEPLDATTVTIELNKASNECGKALSQVLLEKYSTNFGAEFIGNTIKTIIEGLFADKDQNLNLTLHLLDIVVDSMENDDDDSSTSS